MFKKAAIRESKGDRLFMFLIYLFLTLVLIAVAVPLIYIVSSSFSSPQAVTSGKVWLFPVDFTLDGYKAVFNNPQIGVGYLNSLFYTVVGTLINVTLTIMLAYPLAKKSLYGRNFFMVLLVITMMFEGGLIPYYLVVKNLHLLDTRWAMILPGALGVFQVIVARTFFQTTIPDELAEAAELDGCSDIRFIFSIVLPLSKPIIAVMTLMYAVGHWNAYFDALIFLRNPDLFPLQIILRNILILNSVDASMMADVSQMQAQQGLKDLLKYSLIVVASLPVLIIYPFVQKHFVKGVMIGSLKG
ncbi:carbohydrate ABC transporter permease [Virgibacillus sp. LDC1]|jgi:putative aldouronate transport system permease protein|uniref:Carbohydrate ABC transporter permease n=1 Tax=Paenibacillus lautus TaxID=1401 RepID=A0A385TT11_PAELA|nr:MULTISPECIES: carbohydrate ABC transporter permease [Paenibacillus]MBY0164793.1 carbohydrate ABC transporter permease [Cytobacillus firmus]MCV4234451.1 carbohydrate ABC transporter permease [Virgibacillus sp. LDC1]AYB46258.1 carbohydrate ABC transporter permease [Paenibacillus lautus]EGG34725.1 protein LplC [Paenibacillus sp. HGF5]ETT65696.1 binding-protein-dependent transport systems inner membrane component [Paenibacillus sp. FSL H8-457]